MVSRDRLSADASKRRESPHAERVAMTATVVVAVHRVSRSLVADLGVPSTDCSYHTESRFARKCTLACVSETHQRPCLRSLEHSRFYRRAVETIISRLSTRRAFQVYSLSLALCFPADSVETRFGRLRGLESSSSNTPLGLTWRRAFCIPQT